MRVTGETTERLTIESRPWILGSVLILCVLIPAGLGLALIGQSLWAGLGLLGAAALMGVMFVVFVRRVIVIFDRPAGSVVIRTATLMGQSEQTLALSDILGAEVETSRSTSRDSDGRHTTSTTHKPVLRTTSGPVPLTLISSSGNGAALVAAAVNRWLPG